MRRLCIVFLVVSLAGCYQTETVSQLSSSPDKDLTPPVVSPPAADVAALVEGAFKREGTGAKRAKKDRLEGIAPPELQVDQWMTTDGTALNLAALRGDVIVLDFWGVW